MRRLIPATALLLSCGGDRTTGDGPVEVLFWHAMGGPLGDFLEDSLIPQFNATHPDIVVLPVSMGNYGALCQKLLASVLAEDTPVVEVTLLIRRTARPAPTTD